MEYSNQIIEALFQKYKPVFGKDYHRYTNHVYRVFLYCQLIDSDESNIDKYAIASFFHDIGIWTDNTIDYLHPSMEQAKNYLKEAKNSDSVEEITMMIYWHHKMSLYKGKHSKTVETFRKTDWIDVSLGFITFGYDSKKITHFRKKIPNLGFHLFLLNKILKRFLKHPNSPLPMFTK